MGICSSCEAASVAKVTLILEDGTLQEFSYPVKVSYLLQKNPTCFICNSDEMEFDDVVSAIGGDEELQLGQLYFALPLSRLKHRLLAEDMAALAVKATSALRRSTGNIKLMFPGDSALRPSGKVADGGNAGSRRRRTGRRGELTAIPE